MLFRSQMLGFSPESVAQSQRAAIEAKNVSEEIEKRHADLMNAYFIAFDSNDSGMMDKVMQKIDKYNNAFPEYPIRPAGVVASIKRRYKERAMAETTGGARLNKKLAPRLEGMLDYSKD